MLAAMQPHIELLHHLAAALRIIGHSLLPELGAKPIDSMLVAKPEVRELVSLLSLIASGLALPPHAIVPASTGDHLVEPVMEAKQFEGKCKRKDDLSDPWQLSDLWRVTAASQTAP